MSHKEHIYVYKCKVCSGRDLKVERFAVVTIILNFEWSAVCDLHYHIHPRYSCTRWPTVINFPFTCYSKSSISYPLFVSNTFRSLLSINTCNLYGLFPGVIVSCSLVSTGTTLLLPLLKKYINIVMCLGWWLFKAFGLDDWIYCTYTLNS
jgi:hypothetical protein